ncbi:phosphoribosylamine--glycine ligase [Candidatus Woesearchaeota archaeon]|nr:phosphoribosylamine--glycine ligase [Candidatus Woesearchaeota archaeon]
MTSVLLIGHGAREHCIAEALVKGGATLFAVMKYHNPGIVSLAREVKIAALEDAATIIDFAKQKKIDFAFIGPEAVLEAGVVDALESHGIPCVGPKKTLARLETSKGFTRALVEKYKVPGNPRFKSFTDEKGMLQFMQELSSFVVKADGLCAGKGVQVMGDHFKTIAEGFAYAKTCISEAGKVVVEEKLEGEEFSLQCFTDGKTVLPMPLVQDHKRALVGDKGPNTGGMGSYSCPDHLLPFLKQEHVNAALSITKQVAAALLKETGERYHGIMYGGFMLTKSGVKLIEYNARMGDPETMNVLPLLENNLVDVCKAIINEKLGTINLSFAKYAVVCKYVVPQGYPDHPLKNEKIVVPQNKARIYYASVDQRNGGLYLLGSRAIACVGIAPTLAAAEPIAEEAASSIQGKVFHREDIGTKALIDKRVQHLRVLLGSV